MTDDEVQKWVEERDRWLQKGWPITQRIRMTLASKLIGKLLRIRPRCRTRRDSHRRKYYQQLNRR